MTSPGDGQRQLSFYFAIRNGDLTALQTFQFLDRKQNVRVIRAGDDDVVCIVRNRRSDGTAFQFEPTHKADADIAGRAMTFDHDHF